MTPDISRCRATSLIANAGCSSSPNRNSSEYRAGTPASPLLRISTGLLLLCMCSAGSGQISRPGTSSGKFAPAVERAAPGLPLVKGRSVPAHFSGANLAADADPVSLASGDFDGDGVPDLVSGFAVSGGGRISIHRGNINALWPYGAALRDGPPPEFLPDARVFSVPESPEFLVTGDFDADGHWDAVTAARGSNALYFLRGDGHGGFAAAKRIPLAGTITALAAGDVNRRDGLTDLIVAVNSPIGPQLLVMESPNGAIRAVPESFRLPASATSITVGQLSLGPWNDIAVAAGNDLVVIHARDRKLSLSQTQRAAAPPAKETIQHFSYAITAIAYGDFTGAGPGVAAIGGDGSLHILEHSISPEEFEQSWMSKADTAQGLQLHAGKLQKTPAVSGSKVGPGMASRIASIRQSIQDAENANVEWMERSAVPLPSGFSQRIPNLVAARISASVQQDVLALDSSNSQIHVFSTGQTPRMSLRAAADAGSISLNRPSMKLAASLQANSTPRAVLPMRLNQHPFQSMVMTEANDTLPIAMDTQPTYVYTVTTTKDAAPPNYVAGSLRLAITDAEEDSGFGGSLGYYSIVFNIPSTDPGCNASTGVCLLQPVSENLGAGDFNALPPIDANLIVDGYTQPGASPNTLANGDNAKILIQIDGGMASVAGGNGLETNDTIGVVIRGFDFTGWDTPAPPGGIDPSGAGGYGIGGMGFSSNIEGNFVGVDTTGETAKPNTNGIAGNGELFDGYYVGNVIGGTTPQARNLISGNTEGGIISQGASNLSIEGNFIGTDASGTKLIPNSGSGSQTGTGISLLAGGVTVGGTLPGAGNVIDGGVPDSVQINNLAGNGITGGNLVQGNFIGTDVTGTIALPMPQSEGISILSATNSNTIGGTTPTARNIISGNTAGGILLANSTSDNLVQGNYIGLDITGTVIVPNETFGFQSAPLNFPNNPVTDQPTPGNNTGTANNTIGGSIPGAANVISGNAGDGIDLESATTVDVNNNLVFQGNYVQGNFIGTDPTGTKSLPNFGFGIDISSGATNNSIGGTDPGEGNLIANNTFDGVHIDPGAPPSAGQSQGNNTVGNTILSNGGAGVHIDSGIDNLISRNSIFMNGALGIVLGTAGPNLNTPCNATNTGPNDSQNAPVLTAGTGGSAFITATATDPNNNTSEFSNAVAESLSGNVLSLLGNFNSKANTTYTIEFFSSPSADPSGFGQGQTYLGSTTVTTAANCADTISNPVNLTQADMSVTLSSNASALIAGPDQGLEGEGRTNKIPNTAFTSVVENNGPATAHNVVYTDALPAGLQVNTLYCTVGQCQSPITTSLGSCSVSGSTVTCNLGTMAPGTTATINIPVEATATGNLTNTVTVAATEADPNLANNTAGVTLNSTNPIPFIDHLSASGVLVGNTGNGGAPFPLTIFGLGFLPSTTVSVGGTTLPATLLDNQVCGQNESDPPELMCRGLEVQIPVSLLSTAGTPDITVTTPGPGGGNANETELLPSDRFAVVASCSYSFPTLAASTEIVNTGTFPGDDEFAEVNTNDQTCPWTATSSVPWIQVVSGAVNGSAAGNGLVEMAIAPNTGAASRTGTVTIAGQTFSFNEDASSPCNTTLASSSASAPADGGPGNVGVTYTGDPGACATEAISGSLVPWITITPDESIEPPAVNYTVAPNPGGPRSGAIEVGGVALIVNQAAQSCYFTLSSSSGSYPTTASTGSFGVTANDQSCAWTATSSAPTQVAVTSGASGTGNGTVNFSVAANSAGPQTPAITVGNQTASATYTVNQASAVLCSFALSATDVKGAFIPFVVQPGANQVSVPSAGGGGTFVVVISNFACQWTATSNNPGIVNLTGATSGTGNGAVAYSVAPNSGGPRSLSITAGCETFTINQDGAQLSAPSLTITSVSPASIPAGSPAFTMTVNGANFVSGAAVDFNGVPATTTFVSATQLTATIPANDVLTAGTALITVTNPDEQTSNAIAFSITGANNPAPVITSLQPNTAAAGSPQFTLTVNGTGFISSSVVFFAGNARATTFVSSTQLTATILASDIATAGFPSVVVITPTPGGGNSDPATFTVTAAAAPAATLTPGTLAFTSTNGTTSAAQMATLMNTGNAALTISGITIGGAGSSTFAETNTCGSSLAAGASCAISVTFTPSSVTSFTATLSVADNATGSPQTTTLNGTGTAAAAPAATLTPGTLTFTSTNGTTSAAQMATLMNTGNAALTISGITIGGAGASTFAETNTCGSSLAAGASCTISVTFTPSSVTSFTATLSVADNATGSPQTTTLNGTGTAAPEPGASLTPGTLTFSDTVGTTTAAQTATLMNTGDAPLAISSIAITGANPAEFAETNTCGSSLAAGASCTISVTFTPDSASSFTATLSVTDNAPGTAQAMASRRHLLASPLAEAATTTQTVTLNGTGTAVTTPVASLAPATLTFATTTVGTTTAAQTATLMNTGNGALSITGISITGTNPTDFAQTNTCGSSLAAGASCTVSVTFTPASAANFTASLSIADNASGSPQTLALSGTGVAAAAPGVSLSPATLTFSAVAGATSAAQSTTLMNTGNATLSITGISIAGTNASDFAETNTCGETLVAGASCTISVTFTPASAASFTATVSVADNASGSPQTVTLNGTGNPAPSFTVSSSTPSQTVAPGGTATYSIAVTPQNGAFTSAVTLSASGLPTGATATFAPSSVTPGGAAASSTLTIQTAATTTTASNLTWPLAAPALAALGLFFLPGKRRRRWITLCLLLFASLGALTALSGCGGGFALPTPANVNYNITITATSGSESQTTTVVLTVQ